VPHDWREFAAVKVHFKLSNAQQKELLIRGQRLEVALPVLAELLEQRDALELARELLPDHAGYIVAAEPAEVEAYLTDRTPTGMGAALGDLVGGDCIGIPCSIVAIVATLENPAAAVRGSRPLQWPGSAHGKTKLGPWRIPRPADAGG
jgi:hypothetical protein